MLHKLWGVGLVVVLGLVWFALGEAAGTGTGGAAQVPLKADGMQPDEAQAPLTGAAPPPAAPAARVDGDAPQPAASNAAEPALVRQALKARAGGDEAGAQALLRRAIQEATTVEQAARASLHLASGVTDAAERRVFLSAALEAGVVHGEEYEGVGAQLRELNGRPAESLHALLELETYAVASGDSLWKLCNRTFPDRFGVQPEVGLVRLLNGLKRDTLSVGQKLRIPRQPLVLQVDADDHGLVAWIGDVAIAAYRVGLGKDGSTPRRSFTVQVKQENPAWFYAGRTIPFGDPENILGTRWMGFDNQPEASGFGIHGTTLPDSIGKDESMGCVRMRNGEVEELFEIVSRGTKVTVQ
ncbi:MAG: L,D-transpeptidase family protein [Candidatus Sericytochromatia bacterium]|nr:L,D-transpeptidase family protein [Candidatus Tanganyikabacteria bacterium]